MSAARNKRTPDQPRPKQRKRRSSAFSSTNLTWWRSPLILFSLTLLLGIIALLFIYARPLTQTIALGEPADRAATVGFNAAERTQAGVPYRWTDDRSTLIFRGAGLAFPINRPQLLTLTLAASRPAGVAPPQVTIAATDRSIAQRTVTTEERPAIDLGVPVNQAIDSQITITSSTFSPAGDKRVLGVAVLGAVQLGEGAGSGPAMPPLAAIGRWLLMVAGIWGVVYGFYRRPIPATALSLSILSLITITAFVARPQFWELNHLLLLLLLILVPIAWRDALNKAATQLLEQARQWGITPAYVTLLGVLFLAIGQGLLTSNRSVPLALIVGASGLVIILATLFTSYATTPTKTQVATGRDWQPLQRRELLILSGIIALAAIVRLSLLPSIPFGIWRDEARHGLEALRILNDPNYRPVYIPNISLPGFYPALLALSFKLFGISLATLRGLTATAGVFAVAVLWVVARQLWGPRVALIAALFGAVGSWRVSIDRLAFDTAPTTFCTLAAFACFLAGVRQGLRQGLRLLAFAGAGFFGGLAIYNYYPGRFALPVLVGATVVLLVRERGSFLRRYGLGLLLLVVVALATLVPLAQYAQAEPDNFFKRTEQVFLLSDQFIEGKTKLEAVEQNILRHVGMFNWRGEPNARHHAPGWPMLDGVTAGCFALGLALVLIAGLRFSFPALFTLGWLVALLAPSIVSVDAPSAVRAQDAAPAAYLLAALGLVAIWEQWRATTTPATLRRLTPAICGVALAVAVGINLWIYFLWMPGNPKVLGKFQYVGETRAGLAIHTAHAENPALAVYLPGPFLAIEALQFTAYDTPLQELPTDPAALPPGPVLIVVPRGEERDFAADVAAARKIAMAAGLTEQAGERTPGTNQVTFVLFRRDR